MVAILVYEIPCDKVATYKNFADQAKNATSVELGDKTINVPPNGVENLGPSAKVEITKELEGGGMVIVNGPGIRHGVECKSVAVSQLKPLISAT